MSIKLLSSHFRKLHAWDCPTFCVWQAVSESLWETILQRRAEAFHNSHGVPIPWNLLEFTPPLSDNTARAQDLSGTIFMCKRTMLIVLDYLNKYGQIHFMPHLHLPGYAMHITSRNWLHEKVTLSKIRLAFAISPVYSKRTFQPSSLYKKFVLGT